MDKDGKLSLQEFLIANYLVDNSVGGPPDQLPEDLLPPEEASVEEDENE